MKGNIKKVAAKATRTRKPTPDALTAAAWATGAVTSDAQRNATTSRVTRARRAPARREKEANDPRGFLRG